MYDMEKATHLVLATFCVVFLRLSFFFSLSLSVFLVMSLSLF